MQYVLSQYQENFKINSNSFECRHSLQKCENKLYICKLFLNFDVSSEIYFINTCNTLRLILGFKDILF